MGAEAQQAAVIARQGSHSAQLATSSEDRGSKGEKQANNPRTSLDVVTLILAVLGIGFALWQFRDSRHLVSITENILSDASTRYVAEFPQNLPEITSLINETCGSL